MVQPIAKTSPAPQAKAKAAKPLPSLITFSDDSAFTSGSCKFPTTDNKYRTVNFHPNTKNAVHFDKSIYHAIADFSKGNRADIDNTYKLTDRIYKEIPSSLQSDDYGTKRLEQYDRLMKHYTDPASPGGAKVTRQEQRAFMENWADSFVDPQY